MNQKQKSHTTNSTPDTVSCQKYANRLQREKMLAMPKKSNEITKTKSAEASNPKSPESVKLRAKPVTKANFLKPVTVLCDKSRPRSTTAREAWSDVLANKQSSEDMSSFNNCDPLRTMNFLSKELQTNLKTLLPSEPSVHQMLKEMKLALNRLPPEVSALVHLRKTLEVCGKKADSLKSLQDEIPEKLERRDTLNKYCQTPPTFSEDGTEVIKKIVEKNTIKLETSCMEMQKICDALNNEKQSLENQLKDEKDTVKYLKTQLRDSEYKVDELIKNRVNKLQLENEQLQVQIQKLKVDLQAGSQPEIYKLKAQKFKIEDEYNKVRNDLSLLEIEKEKYVTLLKIRDREIAEYREEMGRYRLEINDTLAKLQNEFADCFIPDEQNQTMGDATISTIESNEHSFKEMPSGDGSQATEKDLLKDHLVYSQEGNDEFKETVQ